MSQTNISFDFQYIIGVCYKHHFTMVTRNSQPPEKKTSLKSLTKANLTSSIEFLCHTEWIAWKTLTTVNWELFQSVFLTVYFAYPFCSRRFCNDSTQFKVCACALIKHVCAISLQCVICLCIVFAFGTSNIYIVFFYIWFSTVRHTFRDRETFWLVYGHMYN